MREPLLFTGMIVAVSVAAGAISLASAGTVAVEPIPNTPATGAPNFFVPARVPLPPPLITAPEPSVEPPAVQPPSAPPVRPSAPATAPATGVPAPQPQPPSQPPPSSTVQPCPVGLVLDPVLGVCVRI